MHKLLYGTAYAMINTNCVELALHSMRPNINQERFLKRKKKNKLKALSRKEKKILEDKVEFLLPFNL